MRVTIPTLGLKIEQRLREIASENPFTPLYGLVRSLVALAGLLTLIANDSSVLFVHTDTETPANCSGFSAISLYCVTPSTEIGRVIGIVILLSVLSGYFPRWSAIPHWWVAFSYQTSSTTIEGGDQVAAVVTLALIPVALLDSRRNHWKIQEARQYAGEPVRLIGLFFLGVLRVQAAIIYFVSGAAKFAEPQWQDGTAMYYWMTHPTFGAPAWQQPFYSILLENPLTVTVITWGVPTFEILVAAALFMRPPAKKLILIGVVLMHGLIAISMGLVSFALVMIALDIIYLWPLNETFKQARATLSQGCRNRSSSLVAPERESAN